MTPTDQFHKKLFDKPVISDKARITILEVTVAEIKRRLHQCSKCGFNGDAE
jgi:hypothetical protein